MLSLDFLIGEEGAGGAGGGQLGGQGDIQTSAGVKIHYRKPRRSPVNSALLLLVRVSLENVCVCV